MHTLQHPKAIITFEQDILWIRFYHGIDIEVSDVKEIYRFALEKSEGKPFCVLFDTAGTDMLREDVVEYVARNPDAIPIKAKAYITGTADHQAKARLHMAFDKPAIKPGIFTNEKEALEWLQGFLDKED
jgi:hypothetical protein